MARLVTAYLTVAEARARARAARDDFQTLWWLWAVQPAWTPSARTRVLALLRALDAPSFRICTLAWCVGYLSDDAELQNQYENLIQLHYDGRRFSGDGRQVGVAEGVDGIFSLLDGGVVVRDCPFVEVRETVVRKILKLLKVCEGASPSSLKAVIATKIMMCVVAVPTLVHQSPRFRKVLIDKLNEFRDRTGVTDPRTNRIMETVTDHVPSTLLQTPLEAWVEAMRAALPSR